MRIMGRLCMCGGHGYMEISVLPFQVFYNPKTALKKISLIKKKKKKST